MEVIKVFLTSIIISTMTIMIFYIVDRIYKWAWGDK
jgi:hypothetical protein